jgi:ubiquinone/menaquinone biosynthesis C-methylase UbiE
MTTLTAELQTLKNKHRVTWAAGDYAVVADRLVPEIGPRLVARIGIGPESEVLDVACGTGNATIPAAAAGARVTGLDLVPGLLETARDRAGDLDVEWLEGDAEDLPFADERFDAVISAIGIQFAPRHDVVAAELARVCRSGGMIGLANWTPEGYIGRFFKTLAPYMPALPEGASGPPLWGSPDHVTALFGNGFTFEFERDSVDFVHDTPASFVDFMAAEYGPLVKAREALGDRWADLRRDLIALSEAMNEDEDGFKVASEFLVVAGRKA